MEKFFRDLTDAFAKYWQSADLVSYGYQLLALFVISVIVIWLLSTIQAQLPHLEKERQLRAYSIYRFWYISGILTIFIIISVISQLDYNNRDNDFIAGLPMLSKFNLLALLAFIESYVIYRFYRWTKTIHRNSLVEFGGISYTPSTRMVVYKELRKICLRWRWAIFLPILGFLMILPYLLGERRAFMAIVLDNSTSMSEPIANGKQALTEALSLLNVDCDYIITTLEDGGKSDMASLLATHNPDNLSGKSRQFSNTADAINYVNSNNVVAENPDSPVTEAIWKTCMLAKADDFANRIYDKRILIVVTDGGDNIKAFPEFFCYNEEFNTIFRPEDVFMVDVHKQGNQDHFGPLFEASEECGYTIGSGKDYHSYVEVVSTVIEGMSNQPPYWTIWAALIYSLFVLVVLFIYPAKITAK